MSSQDSKRISADDADANRLEPLETARGRLRLFVGGMVILTAGGVLGTFIGLWIEAVVRGGSPSSPNPFIMGLGLGAGLTPAGFVLRRWIRKSLGIFGAATATISSPGGIGPIFRRSPARMTTV